MRLLTGVSLICLMMLLACGGGDKNSPAISNGILSGNWRLELQQDPPSTAVKSESGFLVQSKDSLTGSVVLADQTLCPGLGTVQGKVTGSKVDITVNQVAQTVNLKGTASGDGLSMSGTYSILASGCGGGSTTGTWTGTQVKPVNGNYQATFTSARSGQVYSFAIAVSQSPNTGASTANLSGTMTSSDAPCASKLTVSGVVSGTTIVFNFLTSDSVAVGQFRGSTSTDVTTMNGTYDFLAQDNICSGDSGFIVLNQSAM